MSNRINYNSIPSDYVSRFRLDGNGNNDIGSNNAIVTNATWINSDKHYQLKNLSWGATTSFAYTAITYTNSYVFINGVFTKNSPQVTSTALNGVSGSTYSGLIFYNRTLSASEEQAIKLEGDRLFGDKPNYPQLLRGLKAYYDFKGGSLSNLVDGTNATNNGAVVTTDHLGRANNAYSFNGSSSYIGPIINPGITTNVTLSTIISSPNISNAQCIIGNFDQAIATGVPSINIIGGVIYFGKSYVSNDVTYTFSGVNNQTYLITATYDGVTGKIYIDGQLVAQANYTLTYNSACQFVIGRQGTGYYFNGTISSPIILNKALNASEVKELYNLISKEYIYPFSKSSLLSLQKGLVMHLDSNGVDLSGNGNNGTPTAVTPTRRGQSEGGIYNGSSSKINVTGLGSYTSVTFNMQIKLNSYGAPNGGLFGRQGWASGYLHCNTTTTGINIVQFNDSITTNIPLNLNQLYDFIYIRTGGVGYVYLDGVLITSNAISTVATNLSSFDLGNVFDNLRWFNGNIYSPKIRNRALTPKEVEMEYYLNYIN